MWHVREGCLFFKGQGLPKDDVDATWQLLSHFPVQKVPVIKEWYLCRIRTDVATVCQNATPHIAIQQSINQWLAPHQTLSTQSQLQRAGMLLKHADDLRAEPRPINSQQAALLPDGDA